MNELYRLEYSAAGHYPEDPICQARQRKPVTKFVLRLIRSSVSSNEDRVLEIGCGWGFMLEELILGGMNAIGFEPSEHMAGYCLERGLPVRQTTAGEAGLGPGSVRVIASMAVFEHLPDPVAELARYYRLLTPGGKVIIQCPVAHYARLFGRFARVFRGHHEPILPSLFGLLEPPWHACLPTPVGIERAAQSAGLKLEKVYASPSGKEAGLLGTMQHLNGAVAWTGLKLFGWNWPLSMGLVFVLGKPS
ncbi:MAG: methyltransferase domain-containing protein [Veillonellaceae bacterium]|nr:methyltransferase domain-containing protein [Veillonellaceae bacterium]